MLATPVRKKDGGEKGVTFLRHRHSEEIKTRLINETEVEVRPHISPEYESSFLIISHFSSLVLLPVIYLYPCPTLATPS